MEILFWTGLGIVLYSYLGFGLLMGILVRIKRFFFKNPPTDSTFEPDVALVIPCFNEAEFMEAKIQNCLNLDYPSEKIQYIFISDGSTDGTEKLVQKYPQIISLHETERKGKAAAMNRAMQFVKAPVVIFCDANTDLNPAAIREMVKHYQDPKVGAVTGEKRILNRQQENASGAGEGIYWKYESILKQLDSDFYTIVGAAGELMSYRTVLFRELPADTLLDDLMQSMQIALSGYRVRYEKNAWAAESASSDVSEERKRKVRIAAGAFQSMGRLSGAFNFFRHPVVSFLFVSHRVLRWTFAPLSLLLLLVLVIPLAIESGGVYTVALIAQLVFYGMALLGWFYANKQVSIKAFFVPYYFFLMNYCMYLGFIRFLRGKQSTNWERAKRA